MQRRRGLERALVGVVVLGLLMIASGVGSAAPPENEPAIEAGSSAVLEDTPTEATALAERQLQQVETEAGEDESEGDESEGGDEEAGQVDEEGEEERASVIGDWWGLGGELDETPYIGLVELGVVVLGVGIGGYLVGKRVPWMPTQYRRYILPAHEWSMLVGTALTAPHFVAVEKWEGLGFVVGVLLAIEVVSGLYGRHLHRHVIRLGRGDETPPSLGHLLSLSKQTAFARWRWIHRSLTVVTAVVLVLHIVTAIGE